MKIDEVDFAVGFVEGFKTEKDFMKEMNSHGYPEIHKNTPDREKKLKEAYALHHKKPDKVDSQKAEVSTK